MSTANPDMNEWEKVLPGYNRASCQAVPQVTSVPSAPFHLYHMVMKIITRTTATGRDVTVEADLSEMINELRDLNQHVATAIALDTHGLCANEAGLALRIFADEEHHVQALFDKYCDAYEYEIGERHRGRIFLKACTACADPVRCLVCGRARELDKLGIKPANVELL